MAPRKPRHPRQDELALWNKVVQHAIPLHPDRPKQPDAAAPNPSQPAQTSAPAVVPRFRPGQAASQRTSAHDIAPPVHQQIAQHPLQMDKKRFGKMKKGRMAPEARLDLHGLTLAQAHPALTRFLLEAVADGLRLVLIITGKGKSKPDPGPIPERFGVLRHQVPHWLNSPPLKNHVLQISEAHVKHGGQGAYYVYLRRPR